jgi:hypothetical protein
MDVVRLKRLEFDFMGLLTLLFLVGLLLPCLSHGAQEKEASGQVLVRVINGTSPLEVRQLAESVGATKYKKINRWSLYRFDFEKSVSVEKKIRKLRFNRLVQYAEPSPKGEAVQ